MSNVGGRDLRFIILQAAKDTKHEAQPLDDPE